MGMAGMARFDPAARRNVLIYFDVEQKRRILDDLARCLADDGTLFLGSAVKDRHRHHRSVRTDAGLARALSPARRSARRPVGLGPVEIYREWMTAAARWIIAAKL